MPTKRGNSWQGIVYHATLPGGRARRNFETKTEAVTWEHESKAALSRGEPINMGGGETKRVTGKPYTLGELVEYVCRTHWAPMKGGSSAIRNAHSIVKVLGPSLPVHKLGRHELDNAKTKLLAAGNQPATVNRKLAAISKALAIAEDLEIIDRRPKVTKFRETEHRIRRVTPQEEAAMLLYCERIGDEDLHDYITLSLDTGLRQSEVLGLQFRDVTNGRVTVWGDRSKSGKSRTVPLTKRAQETVERRRAAPGGSTSPEIFPALVPRSVHYRWGRMAEVLGLSDDPQFVPHVLRHEFCSRLADRGLNAPVIQALAGHSTLAVTQRYIHINGDALALAIKALEAA